ncbi:hypothetical protein ACF065_32110 [Streptomyces sp. NPDC015232]|uniref:Uncharacterized protein n=1 Tax=Streptomyces zinciresistens K42 TaxID=700597 RepID=G2G9Y4_9ACTN|nr:MULTISPECIES: hypothetical protein [Streptomyces]EGX59695.1 hypothetical protein SZN_11523 [Streptomyces zinciresistens K42]
MTHARTRRHRIGRWRLPGRLRWLIGGDDHRLARARYGTRESASERAERRERTARRTQRARQVRTAARKGQQWEDEAYASLPLAAACPRDPATVLSTQAVPLLSVEHGPHGDLPALPPGFAPATADESSVTRSGAPEQVTADLAGPDALASGRPVLYVIDGLGPRPPSRRPMPERRTAAAGIKTGSR